MRSPGLRDRKRPQLTSILPEVLHGVGSRSAGHAPISTTCYASMQAQLRLVPPRRQLRRVCAEHRKSARVGGVCGNERLLE